MNFEFLKNELEKDGWKNLHPDRYLETDFNLVGSRYFTLTKWTILVKVLPTLDQAATEKWKTIFETTSKKSQSYIWGKCFIMCLIAEDVSPDVLQAIKTDTFGLFGVIRVKGGGGNLLIADIKNKEIYGKVPSLPLDVHKFSKSTKDILIKAL